MTLRPDRPVLTDALTHTHPLFLFLSLCPNSVADEADRRPCCTPLSDCPRRRGPEISHTHSSQSHRSQQLSQSGSPSPIVDPRPGQGPGCSSSQRLESHRTERQRAAWQHGAHAPAAAAIASSIQPSLSTSPPKSYSSGLIETPSSIRGTHAHEPPPPRLLEAAVSGTPIHARA